MRETPDTSARCVISKSTMEELQTSMFLRIRRRKLGRRCGYKEVNNRIPIFSRQWREFMDFTSTNNCCTLQNGSRIRGTVRHMALSNVTRESVAKHQLMQELKINILPPLIHCDNQGALAIAENPINYQRSKHIDIRSYFIRHAISNTRMYPRCLRKQSNFLPSNGKIAHRLTPFYGVNPLDGILVSSRPYSAGNHLVPKTTP